MILHGWVITTEAPKRHFDESFVTDCTSFDNNNDDNEIIVIIDKWQTNHVQEILIKRTRLAGLVYMKYIEPDKRNVKPSWCTCPNISFIKHFFLFQSRNSAKCWNSFNLMSFLSCTCMSIYIYIYKHIYIYIIYQVVHIWICTYICMCTPLNTNLTWLPIMHWCIRMVLNVNRPSFENKKNDAFLMN